MQLRILVLSIVLLALGHASTAGADEIDELREQIQTQNQQLGQLQKNLDELEAKQKQQDRQAAALPDNLKWLDRITISGDLRYRHDSTNREAVVAGIEDQLNGENRNRIRARLMIEAMLSKDLDVGIRFASGSTRTPNSTNQDLEDAFSSKNLWLDLAYFDWHPEMYKGLNVFGGKMKFPFYKVVKHELMMDNDVNPEGLAFNYVMDISDADQLFFNGGGFWVDEDSAGVDTSLWGAQTYLKHKLSKPDYVLAGASFYDYANLQGRTALSRTWSSANLFFGNTRDTSSDANGVYASDFDIFEAFAEYGFEYNAFPVALFGSWMKNTVASTGEDTGWLLGARFNKMKDPGSWEFTYEYRELDADAVVGGFTESDFVAGRTDSRGHSFVAKYQIAKPVQAVVTYHHAEDTSNPVGNLDFHRLMADLVFKF